MTADVSKYLTKIPPLHSDKPKFMATLAVALQPFVDVNNFIASLPTQVFDIDYAIGVQLDILGLWIGRLRQIPIPLQDVWFTWGDPLRGWGRGIWFDPNQNFGSTYTNLDDDAYRRLLKACAIANEWDGTVEIGQAALDEFFLAGDGTYSFIDNRSIPLMQDATVKRQVTIGVSGKVPSIIDLCILSQDLLKLNPAGVKIQYMVTSVDGAPIFGWGVDNEYIGGWGRGAWGVAPAFYLHQDQALFEA